MAVQELGGIAEIEGWEAPVQKAALIRLFSSLKSFARKKPLGFICGVIVIFFFVIGDVVPETVNHFAKTAGLGTPLPYMADQLDHTFSWLYPYAKQDLRARLQGASAKHLLGTDELGRDILSRLMYGARVAVMVSCGAVFISMIIGATVGIMSGFYGSWVDKFLYRIVDVFQALPPLVIFIVILGMFGHGLWQLVIVLGAIGGPIQSRTIRGQTIYVMASPFIEAARVVGCSDRRIMVRYILPNVFALIVLNATFSLGFLVLLEATLSFLGYGLAPPFPSWGQMLSGEGRQYMRTQPGLSIYPGLAIGMLVFSFNLFGDALRDVLDPRLRGSR
jgi:peptide/nickel transport system permease protein